MTAEFKSCQQGMCSSDWARELPLENRQGPVSRQKAQRPYTEFARHHGDHSGTHGQPPNQCKRNIKQGQVRKDLPNTGPGLEQVYGGHRGHHGSPQSPTCNRKVDYLFILKSINAVQLQFYHYYNTSDAMLLNSKPPHILMNMKSFLVPLDLYRLG